MATNQTNEPPEDRLPTRATLLERLTGGRGTAAWQAGWQEFFSLYQPVIRQYVVNSGFTPAEAEEIAQEILIGVARQMPTYRYEPEKCAFKTWLFRVCRNKMADKRRRLGAARRRHIRDEIGETELELIPDDGVLTPDRAWDLEFEQRLRQAALQQVGQRVKPMTMRLFLYHVVEGHDIAETVTAFRDSKIKAEDVYQAKFRVQAMWEERIATLRQQGG